MPPALEIQTGKEKLISHLLMQFTYSFASLFGSRTGVHVLHHTFLITQFTHDTDISIMKGNAFTVFLSIPFKYYIC
jgi:hypothetical protein